MSVSKIIQLKVSLGSEELQIWRRFLVPASFSFYELHVSIHDAMGWKFIHSYKFKDFSTVPGQEIRRPIGPLPLLDIDFRIGDFFKSPGDTGVYLYDFNCLWEHRIETEAIHDRSLSCTYPMSIGGMRACPPEAFVGGIKVYEDHVRVLANPDHPDHEKCRDRLIEAGGSDRPEQFSFTSVLFTDGRKHYERSQIQPVTV